MAYNFEQCDPKTDAEKKLVEKYREVDLGSNDACMECRAKNSRLGQPVGAWVVGQDFYKHDKKVLFVGKTAVGKQIYHLFKWSREGGWDNNYSAYWSYTKAITEKIYGNDSIENIAFTNLVKCNDVADGEGYSDTTNDTAKECCINELGVFIEEVKIIRPTHMIFYTGWYYDKYIKKLFKFSPDTDWGHREKIGARNMPWTKSTVTIDGLSESVNFLRIGHPQYKKKVDFVDKVSQWVLNT